MKIKKCVRSALIHMFIALPCKNVQKTHYKKCALKRIKKMCIIVTSEYAHYTKCVSKRIKKMCIAALDDNI